MNARLTLLGRDFAGYRDAIAEQQDSWPGGRVAGDWREFPELEREVLHGTACTDGSTDLIMVPADWIPALAAADGIRPLERTDAADSFLGRDGWTPWASSFRSAVAYGGRYWALPYHDGPQLLFRRTDLYDDPAERARFAAAHGRPLEAPRDWDDLLDQARWFTRPGEDLWGTVFAGHPDGHNNVYDFVAQLWRHGGDVFDDEGRAAFASGAGVVALEWLRAAFDSVVAPRARGLDSVQSGEEFAAGRVAVAVNWAGFAVMAAANPRVRDRFRCSLVFDDSPTVNAFWAVAVTAGSRHPEAAVDLLRHLSRPESDRITTLRGACGARSSSWSDPEILERYPEQALFARAHAASRPLPSVPQLPAVVAELNTAVDDVVQHGADARVRLTAAAARVDALRTPGSAAGRPTTSR